MYIFVLQYAPLRYDNCMDFQDFDQLLLLVNICIYQPRNKIRLEELSVICPCVWTFWWFQTAAIFSSAERYYGYQASLFGRWQAFYCCILGLIPSAFMWDKCHGNQVRQGGFFWVSDTPLDFLHQRRPHISSKELTDIQTLPLYTVPVHHVFMYTRTHSGKYQ